GIATCNTITLGSSSGNHTYTAVVAGAGSVTFGATANPATSTSPTVVRIYEAPSGTDSIGTRSLTNGQTLALRAVIFRPADSTILKETSVSWTTTGTLRASDLSTSAGGARVTLTPSVTSTGSIQAYLTNPDEISNYNVQAPFGAITGTITASITQTPTQVLVVSGNSQSAPRSTTLPNPFQVKVLDASNSVVPNITVTFSTSSGGSVSCSGGVGSAVTGSDGIASCFGVLGSTAGNQSFSASVAGAGAANFSATATSASVNPPAAVAVAAGSISSGTAGQALSGLGLIARVSDSGGASVQGTSVTFSVVSGGGSINCTNPKPTDSDGLVACNVTLGSSLGSQVFQATVTGSSPTLSTNFTVTAAHPPTRLRIYPLAGTSAVGNLNLTIGDPAYQMAAVLEDLSGNLINDSASPVTATWTVSGLSSARLSTSGAGKFASYNPTGPDEIGVITAIASSASMSTYNITQATTATGIVTVAYALLPDRISIVTSTNNQVATTRSDVTLTANVKNTGNVNVPGASVRFQPATGGGTVACISFANCSCVNNQDCTVATDSSGNASIRATLGCQTGAGNQTYRATISGAGLTVPQVIFNATGTPGLASSLAFTTSPGGANAGSTFGTQPVVEVRDSCGNVITSDNTTVVTIPTTPNTGTGTVEGTRTATAVSGVASFVSLNYSTAEAGVRINASATLNGNPVTATSGSFTVGAIIAAAQCAAGAPAGWSTTEGGCRDLTSGLVWSARSASTMNWHNAVWDSTVTGSAPEALEVSRGIVRDVTGSGSVDAAFGAYCHDLVESGYSDWRMPTTTEWTSAHTNNATAGLQNYTGTTYWTSTGSSATIAARFLNGVATTDGNSNLTMLYSVRCVRQTTADRMVLTSQPSSVNSNIGHGRNIPFYVQPIIALRDSSNSIPYPDVRAVTISASVSGGSGSLAGTTTVNTSNGVATFTDLRFNGSGTVTLTASAPGIQSVTSNPFTVNETIPFAQCKATSGAWINANGGCKHVGTGLIFSHRIGTIANPLGALFSWHEAVWGGAIVGGPNSDPDTFDNGLLNDYDPATTLTGNFDNSGTHLCKNLNVMGFEDWRLPTSTEMALVDASVGNSKLIDNTPGSTIFWNSSSQNANSNSASFTFLTGNESWAVKTTTYSVACVRRDPPASLVFSTQAGANANGFGAGIPFTTPPVVQTRDTDNTPVSGNGTIQVTLRNSDGSTVTNGAQLCTLNNNYAYTCGSTLTVDFSNGSATLSSLTISKPGSYILRASTSNLSWNGVNLGPSLAAVNSATIVIPDTFLLSRCASGYTTTNGGCMDGNGKVWSHIILTPNQAGVASGLSWHEAVSANDYDAALPPGAGGVDINPSVNICDSLILNGFEDWRLPTRAEYNALGGQGGTQFNWQGQTNWSGWTIRFWTSSTDSATPGNAFYARSAPGLTTISTSVPKSSGNPANGFDTSNGYLIRCIRN
ncbi:MAG: DUF1566 domain-containing protein, partial [Bdellovibrionales bacterium]|nr:DUF1566 domain-containing protein [Bdellovibrionales bacterium]